MKTLGKGQFLCTYNIVYQCSQHMRFSSRFLSNLLQISIIRSRCWDQNRKVKQKPKIKIQLELPISKLPSLGQQDKKCPKGSQKCVFFPCQISSKPALFKCLDKLDKIKWNNCFVWPHLVVCPDSYTKSELTEFEEKLL